MDGGSAAIDGPAAGRFSARATKNRGQVTTLTYTERWAIELQVSTITLAATVFGWTADGETSFAVDACWTRFQFIDTPMDMSRGVPGNSGG